jgi:hypothetical protein
VRNPADSVWRAAASGGFVLCACDPAFGCTSAVHVWHMIWARSYGSFGEALSITRGGCFANASTARNADRAGTGAVDFQIRLATGALLGGAWDQPGDGQAAGTRALSRRR